MIQTRNSAGNTSSSTVYWPYGEVRTSTGTNPTPWSYVGTYGYHRDTAELTYVRARYYRPALTRWMTVDKLWPDESAYGYVRQCPASLVDPSGMQGNAGLAVCAIFGNPVYPPIVTYPVPPGPPTGGVPVTMSPNRCTEADQASCSSMCDYTCRALDYFGGSSGKVRTKAEGCECKCTCQDIRCSPVQVAYCKKLAEQNGLEFLGCTYRSGRVNDAANCSFGPKRTS